MVGGASATVLGRAVDLAEAANTDGLAHVDVAGDGGGADVVPVGVLGRELVGSGGLDSVNPSYCDAVSWVGLGSDRSRSSMPQVLSTSVGMRGEN